MIYAMTCGTKEYMKSAQFQLDTAIKHGKVDKTIIYKIEEMSDEFKEKNQHILNSGTRKGCYVWKPFFIKKALDEIEYGSYLFYLDAAGDYYASSVKPMVKYMQKNNYDIMCSRQGKELEKTWTKRDTFVIMCCDEPRFTEHLQCHAARLVVKKTESSVRFIDEWLMYAQNINVISDIPNICGLPNYEGFKEHRYDQSILSLLCTKYNVPSFNKSYVTHFFVYHHSMLTSIKEIKKKRLNNAFDSLKKKSIKWFLYNLKDYTKCFFIFRWIDKKVKYLNK